MIRIIYIYVRVCVNILESIRIFPANEKDAVYCHVKFNHHNIGELSMKHWDLIVRNGDLNNE